MPKITINGKQVECREGIPVLRAAIEAGLAVPHYCYHPGLTVVASCRLCLMEMKMPHPQTKELVWSPKLVPSCQTPVKDGLEVRFDSEKVQDNQRHVMEYYLLNHPLDCPVCDKAGECYLQDYTEEFGSAHSRMVEEKQKNPKKDIGAHTLLYQDRCVLCTRCVRFCGEVAGSGELAVVNRGNRGEIDVFPGVPLANKLQGNVVDLCPVGALIDKDFLFKQRVWLLRSAKSVCNRCSAGCTIFVDHNDQGLHRIRPRCNERVNQWWICDDGRFGWRYLRHDGRLTAPRLRRGGEPGAARWEELPELLRLRFAEEARADGGTRVAAVLSPMMTCEEAWLLTKFIRTTAPAATLVGGYVPVVGQDQAFPKGFTIRAEKCPNARGVERVLKHFGGAALGCDEFLKQAGAGKFAAAYVVGGYPPDVLDPAPGSAAAAGAAPRSAGWVTKEMSTALGKIGFLVSHDLFPTALEPLAAVTIPSAAWVEREGSFVNVGGLLQPFDRARPPLEGVKPDGQFFWELTSGSGLFRAAKVREMMGRECPDFGQVHIPVEEPEHAH